MGIVGVRKGLIDATTVFFLFPRPRPRIHPSSLSVSPPCVDPSPITMSDTEKDDSKHEMHFESVSGDARFFSVIWRIDLTHLFCPGERRCLRNLPSPVLCVAQERPCRDQGCVESYLLSRFSSLSMTGRPCKIVDMSTSKTGKHGHAKVHIVAIDVRPTIADQTIS